MQDGLKPGGLCIEILASALHMGLGSYELKIKGELIMTMQLDHLTQPNTP